MEADKYGLTRGTCFVACRLQVVAVAGLLWIPWCVLGAADFFVFLSFFFFFEHPRPAASMRPLCLIYLPTSIPIYLIAGPPTAVNIMDEFGNRLPHSSTKHVYR